MQDESLSAIHFATQLRPKNEFAAGSWRPLGHSDAASICGRTGILLGYRNLAEGGVNLAGLVFAPIPG